MMMLLLHKPYCTSSSMSRRKVTSSQQDSEKNFECVEPKTARPSEWYKYITARAASKQRGKELEGKRRGRGRV